MGDGVRIFQLTELEVFGAGYTEAQPREFDGGLTTANLLSEPSSETGRATRLGELYDRDAQIAYAYRALRTASPRGAGGGDLGLSADIRERASRTRQAVSSPVLGDFTVYTHYAHAAEAFNLRPGDRVTPGREIGRMGNTGA